MKTAMILAAGLGTRLRPYSDLRPKPLFPVLGRPLLAYTLDRLRCSGFGPLVVNAHHLRDQVAATLADQEDLILQSEEQILGTGGGLRRALTHFGSEPVLVVNGDIFHSIDYDWVYREHCRCGAAVTMVLHDCPRFNKVAVTEEGFVAGFDAETDPDFARRAFTGIHVIDPAVLRSMPADTFYDIIDCYRALIRSGGKVRALPAVGHFWTDMGTPADYLALHGALLRGEVAGQSVPSSPFYVHPSARLAGRLQLDDWVAIGADASVGEEVSLRRVVVWDGASVPAGSDLCDCIVS